jgi:tetratricopeptide (TPR) repeat protein
VLAARRASWYGAVPVPCCGVLPTPAQRTLEAAIGYYELGMLDDALRELDSLADDDQAELDVLELRSVLYQHQGRWADAALAHERLCHRPDADTDRFIAWGCCLYELNRIADCRAALLTAPEEARAHGLWNFHLACYEAILGNREEARRLVRRSLELDPRLRRMAELNENLTPLL